MASATVDFHGQKMEDLRNYSHIDSKELKGTKSVWVLFQPQCPSCKRQLTELDCLPAEVERIAIGIRGRREQLASEVRSLRFKGRAVKASPALESSWKDMPTPTTFLVAENGDLLKTVSGYRSCSDLLQALQTPFKKTD